SLKRIPLEQGGFVYRRSSSARDRNDRDASAASLQLLKHVNYETEFVKVGLRFRVWGIYHSHRRPCVLQRLRDRRIKARALVEIRFSVPTEYHICGGECIHRSLLLNAD